MLLQHTLFRCGCASACNTDTTPTQPHRNSNTHRNKNTRPMWWYNRKVASYWWWMYYCPKHVEHRRSEIKLNNQWHQVGLLFFNYHNDARSSIHEKYNHCCVMTLTFSIKSNSWRKNHETWSRCISTANILKVSTSFWKEVLAYFTGSLYL